MRMLIVIVSLCCVAQCADRFLDEVHLGTAKSETVKDSSKSVKIIVVVGSKASYVLKCNEDDETCHTPDPGTDYTLVSNPDLRYYKCENVALAIPRRDTYRGFYCLIETRPRN